MNVALWYGPFAASAMLLVAAGMAKAARPARTTAALRATGLPSAGWLVRTGATAEVAVGVSALWGSRAGAFALAASYAAFAIFVASSLVRGTPVGSCGCFGESDSAPTRVHLVINVAASALGLGAARSSLPTATAVMHAQPFGGVPLAIVTGTVAYLAFVAMTELPRLAGARRAAVGS